MKRPSESMPDVSTPIMQEDPVINADHLMYKVHLKSYFDGQSLCHRLGLAIELKRSDMLEQTYLEFLTHFSMACTTPAFYELIDKLINLPLDMLLLGDEQGRTLMHLAVLSNCEMVVDRLLGHLQLLQAKDLEGLTCYPLSDPASLGDCSRASRYCTHIVG